MSTCTSIFHIDSVLSHILHNIVIDVKAKALTIFHEQFNGIIEKVQSSILILLLLTYTHRFLLPNLC